MRSAAALLRQAVAVELRMVFAALEASAALNMVCCCMMPLFYLQTKLGALRVLAVVSLFTGKQHTCHACTLSSSLSAVDS